MSALLLAKGMDIDRLFKFKKKDYGDACFMINVADLINLFTFILTYHWKISHHE